VLERVLRPPLLFCLPYARFNRPVASAPLLARLLVCVALPEQGDQNAGCVSVLLYIPGSERWRVALCWSAAWCVACPLTK